MSNLEKVDYTSYLCNIDSLNYKNNILDFRGWVFNVKKEITSIELLLIDRNQEYRIAISNAFKERRDVFEAYKNENSLYSGFFSKIRIQNVNSASIYLEVNKEYRIQITEIKSSLLEKIKFYKKKLTNDNVRKIIMFLKKNQLSKVKESAKRAIIEEIDKKFENINLIEFKKENVINKLEYPSELYKYTIDVIVPVYNGYEYLENLFTSIVKTKVNYRLIVINDKSSDARVGEALRYYANCNEKIMLLENNENLGFVKTVNRGFKIAVNNIALVNTDVELPDMWLERLMYPIILNKDIASSTPFTNCGTICSFPNFCEDNEIFEKLDVNYIDKAFQSIKPFYTNIPTGVGFCMGINKKAMDEVGSFDAETFSKGYGEENDWCQRAIRAGYKNVHVENLYVYHKHGGSFLSEEKKKLLRKNGVLLSKKHPNYNEDVSNYCGLDPVKNIRNYIIFKILSEKSEGVLIYFDHNIGGGATNYLETRIKQDISNEESIIIIRYDRLKKIYLLNYKYKIYNLWFNFMEFDEIISVLEEIKIEKIFINELFTYPDIYNVLEKISDLKANNNVNMTMFVHDFFSICPTVNLLNDQGNYCNIPHMKKCEYCLRYNELNIYFEYGSMEQWRTMWGRFLEKCNNIIVFSKNSKELIQKCYDINTNICVIPHTVDYIGHLYRGVKSTKTLNIGVLGTLNYNKGFDIIKQMLDKIEALNLDINIILIGSTVTPFRHKNFKQTGRYMTDMIPKLVLENDIDLFFVSSIWPETYSYTTQEIINMNLPVVCFNLGAQAERIGEYDKGLVLEDFDVDDILSNIVKFSKQHI